MSSEAEQQSDQRAIIADGVSFSVMVGLGESYVPAFALAIGLGEVAAGLIATVPMLAGAVLQLVTPFAVRRLRSYRRWVVWCARLQALSFLPLIVGALLGRIDLAWVALGTVVYWAFGMSAGPAWNAWITTLVPAEIREIFFARRTRAAQSALLVGLLVGGSTLELARGRGVELPLFAALFGGALVARWVSSLCLQRHSEEPALASGHTALGPIAVWRSLRDAHSLRVLRYLLAMQVATNVAAPFFTPYMLSHLALSYGQFMVLNATSFVARVAVLPLLGQIARDRGFRNLLWIGGLAIVPLPLLWLVSDAFAWLMVVQLVAGCAWAAVELATTLAFFGGIEERDRASVLTAFNLANAIAMALGSLIGARLMVALDASPYLYAGLFAVSSSGRLLAAALLRSTPDPRELPHAMELRTLAVRPSGIAVQRPILASIEDEPAAGGDAPRDAV